MKLADIKVDEEYGALESPTSKYGDNHPRRVKVLEIITEPTTVGSRWSDSRRTTNKKRIKVVALDAPVGSYLRGVDRIEKDATMVIDARNIVALWSEIKGEIKEKIDNEAERVRQQEELAGRLAALELPKDEDGYFHREIISLSTGSPPWSARLDLKGAGVYRLLELAEAGKGLIDAGTITRRF